MKEMEEKENGEIQTHLISYSVVAVLIVFEKDECQLLIKQAFLTR